jgi:hypothetical protein
MLSETSWRVAAGTLITLRNKTKIPRTKANTILLKLLAQALLYQRARQAQREKCGEGVLGCDVIQSRTHG